MNRTGPTFPRVIARLKIMLLFFAVSLIHLYPIIINFFSKLPYAGNGDVRLSLTILYSNVHKLSQLQFDQLYHLPFLFPLSNTLTIGFTLFGQSVLLMPFFLFGEPNIYALYNGVTVFSYLAAGFGAYLFFRELQDNEVVSVISSCLYIVLPFRVYNIPHLSMLFNFPIPFAFYFLLKYLKKNRKTDLLYLNVVLLFQFLSELSLGFFLSIALAFFVFFYLLIQRPFQFRCLGWMFISLLPTMALILLIHLPFLNKEISLSPSAPAFDPAQYHPALSFYANKSSLLLFLNRIWDLWPLFPGFSVLFFYFYAFSTYIASLKEKLLFAITIGAYAVPGMIAVIVFQKKAFATVNSIAEICLALFWFSLALVVFLLRKKIPLQLKLLSLLLLAVLFITFEPFPRIFDLFNALAGFFPFLNRSRGLRTLYILPLATLGIFAVGLKSFLATGSRKKKWLWAIILVLLLEHFRWPVIMAKLPEATPGEKKIYETAAAYPSHFGILELPFVQSQGNTYSLFSRYHNKHTYHGHYLKYNDPLHLKNENSLQAAQGFSGLKNPDLLKNLKAFGIYLIVINGSFPGHARPGAQRLLWRKIGQNIQAAAKTGFIKKIKEESNCFLIVLDDGQTGKNITYPLPFFALVGKKTIKFMLRVKAPTHSRVYFNEHLITARECIPGEHLITMDLRSLPKQKQINRVRIQSDQPTVIGDWLIE